MKHIYKPHAPSGVKTQVWSPLEHIFHQIGRLKWWQECWGKSPSPAAYTTLANINHNLQRAIWAAQNPSKAHTVWTRPECYYEIIQYHPVGQTKYRMTRHDQAL